MNSEQAPKAEGVFNALKWVCDPERRLLQNPFRDGNYMAATNGRAAVRYMIPDGERALFPDDDPSSHPATAGIFPLDEEVSKGVEIDIGLQNMMLTDGVKAMGEFLSCDSRPDGAVYVCPCCRSSLYEDEDDGELHLIDEYNDRRVSKAAFILRIPECGVPGFSVGCKCMLDFMRCIRDMGGAERMFMVERTGFYASRLLVCKGKGFEGICLMRELSEDYSPFKRGENVLMDVEAKTLTKE